jgi:signal peptidase II
MTQAPNRKTIRPCLFGLLIAFLVVADQLSKAFVVYRLGEHPRMAFTRFLAEYFTLWTSLGDVPAISAHYTPFKPGIPVWEPWIRISLATNSGAAWSIFEGYSFALSFVSIAMALLLYYIWWRSFRTNPGMTWALGAIIGGALGNFLDRFRMKEVVDFVSTKIPLIGKVFPSLGDPYDFPIFNVADSCAVCGTIALAAYLILADLHGLKKHKDKAQVATAAFTPYRQGLDVSLEALEELKHAAVAERLVTVFGLTRHRGLPASGNNEAADAGGITKDVMGDGGQRA